MQRPDQVVARPARREVEERMGIAPLEELLEERRTLVRQVASLRARYGPFGTADNLRKIELSRLGAILRAQATERQEKVTEAKLDEMAHADPRYTDFVTIQTRERADWIILEDAIQAIEDQIRRDNTLASYLTAEARL